MLYIKLLKQRHDCHMLCDPPMIYDVNIMNFEPFNSILLLNCGEDLLFDNVDITACRLNGFFKVTAVRYNPHPTVYGVAMMVLNFNI